MSEKQQQFVYLARLAWDLRALGVATLVDLPREAEPAVVVVTADDQWRVRAVRHGGGWRYAWGRRADQQVAAGGPEAARRIAAVLR